MKIAIIGNGQLGTSFNKITSFPIIKKDNNNDIKNYDILINCTSGYILPEIKKFINKQIIINCCKGIYKNKTASDYFENIYSIGGFYLYSHLEKKKENIVMQANVPIFIKNIIESYFNVQYFGTNKQIEMCGVAKNISLIQNKIFNELDLNNIFKITNINIIHYYYQDFILSQYYKSRNYRFGKMYSDGINIKDILKKIGLVEGLNSLLQFNINDKFLNNIKDEYYREFKQI